MIGDIDFLLPEKDVLPAAEKLEEQGYFNPLNFNIVMLGINKHYPRLHNENGVAAIEIHRQPVLEPYSRKFNFDIINREKKELNVSGEAYVLSDHHQIVHNMMNTQMNDRAFKLKKLLFRNIYDLLLLSERKDPLETAVKFGHYSKQFNAYLIVASKFLGDTRQIKFNNNAFEKKYYRGLLFFIDHPRVYSIHKIIQYLMFRLGRYIKLPFIAIFNKAERRAFIGRLSNRSWYIAHLKSWHNIRN